MKLAAVVCASLMVTVTVAVTASEAEEAAQAPAYEVPAPLAELLAAADSNGRPVVTERERAYFDALPDVLKANFATAVDGDLISTPGHLAEILSLGLSPQKLELVVRDNCVLCHSNPEMHEGPTLFSIDPTDRGSPAYMNLSEMVNDVHFRYGLSCAGCHGGDPTDEMGHDFPDVWPADRDERIKDRSWIPAFCGRCHADPTMIRRFNPSLPTDQLAKYKDSRHGYVLLQQHDSRAAQCVSCHGRHGILSPESPLSSTHATHVPETCGRCHADKALMAGFTLPDGAPLPTDQLEKYRKSVHGVALLQKGDLGAPACNDCHGNHATTPPAVTSVAQVCRVCHVGNGTLFDGSKHKQAFDSHGWPECGACHGDHAIEKTSDEMLGHGSKTLCIECHRLYAKHDPLCIATADHFYASLTELARDRAQFTPIGEELARRGIDAEAFEQQLTELSDNLKQARSYIHTFDRGEFDHVADRGFESVKKLKVLLKAANAEYSYRRYGLYASIASLLVLMLVIYLKLKRYEKEH
jgi:hypothetical protein